MKKQRKRREHPLFDYAYEEDITFECPVRGIVTQRVLVRRYKSKMQAVREAEIISNEGDLEGLLENGGFHIEDDKESEE